MPRTARCPGVFQLEHTSRRRSTSSRGKRTRTSSLIFRCTFIWGSTELHWDQRNRSNPKKYTNVRLFTQQESWFSSLCKQTQGVPWAFQADIVRLLGPRRDGGALCSSGLHVGLCGRWKVSCRGAAMQRIADDGCDERLYVCFAIGRVHTPDPKFAGAYCVLTTF